MPQHTHVLLYGEQMALYCRALAQATGLPVRETTLFSLELGVGSARRYGLLLQLRVYAQKSHVPLISLDAMRQGRVLSTQNSHSESLFIFVTILYQNRRAMGIKRHSGSSYVWSSRGAYTPVFNYRLLSILFLSTITV